MVPDRRNYTVAMRTGEDGTQYVRIREAPSAQGRSARQWASAVAESLTMFKAGFQKALRFASRRA